MNRTPRTSSLQKISNDQLLAQTKNLAQQEREILLEILHHLKEIDVRKLFLQIGYPSLWAYCTQELQYSEASAQRRIEAMRALRDLPNLEEKIESGALSLSNVAKAQTMIRRAVAAAKCTDDFQNTAHLGAPPPIPDCRQSPLDIDQKIEIFVSLENKTQKEAEIILAKRFPEAVRPIKKIHMLDGKTAELKLTASRELLEKLEKVKARLSHKNPNPSLAETLELMADFVIAKKDLSVKVPDRLWPSRTPPLRRSEDAPLRQRHVGKPQKPSADPLPPGRKSIPTAIRRQVWQSAKACCEYTDPKTGRRCGTHHQLEVEHVQPKAFGGSDDIQNLKLYCRQHNRLAAQAATLMG